jgi:hypothetical protein
VVQRGGNGGTDGAHRGRGKNGGGSSNFGGVDGSLATGVDQWSPG